jgi:hypothetical protein
MNRKTILIGLVGLIAMIVMTAGHSRLTTKPAIAQASDNYNLEWHIIGGGGQPVASASYLVNSTAGQAVASPPYSSGSAYMVSSGYWFVPHYSVYLPLILRNY